MFFFLSQVLTPNLGTADAESLQGSTGSGVEPGGHLGRSALRVAGAGRVSAGATQTEDIYLGGVMP